MEMGSVTGRCVHRGGRRGQSGPGGSTERGRTSEKTAKTMRLTWTRENVPERGTTTQTAQEREIKKHLAPFVNKAPSHLDRAAQANSTAAHASLCGRAHLFL